MERCLGTLFLAIALGITGQVIYKYGALKLQEFDLLQIITNPYFILGSVFYGISAILWFWSLSKLELSFAYPFLAISYVAIMTIGILVFKEQLLLSKIIGITFIITGLIIMYLGF